jgi:hypothetical protein
MRKIQAKNKRPIRQVSKLGLAKFFAVFKKVFKLERGILFLGVIDMRKMGSLALTVLILFSLVAMLPLSVSAVESTHLMVVEWYGNGRVTLNAIPLEDNSATNPDYKLLRFHWYTTAEYLINPKNKYGILESDVVNTIQTSANTWDVETTYEVFSYKGTTAKLAGEPDGYNVVSWGTYSQANVIAVTFIWYTRGTRILETDTLMNVYFAWSLSGETGKMDVQNIMTHEFGHWCGLNDLYRDKDYWLTMYGYASYGETYKRDLGLGDILGLQAVYGE